MEVITITKDDLFGPGLSLINGIFMDHKKGLWYKYKLYYGWLILPELQMSIILN